MAIINGNYAFLNLNGIKGNIIDTFSSYFGEEYRDTISTRLDRVLFVPYHSMSYVNEYYLEHISQYEDEIISLTLSKLGLEPDYELLDILKCCSNIKDNKLSEAVYYGNSISKCIAKKVDTDTLIPVARAFGIDTGDPVEDRKALVDIYKVYLSAIREVENNHPCDVFRDIQMIEQNTITYTKYLLKKAVELGLPVGESDVIYGSDTELCDFLDMDAYGSLFVDNVSYPGSISYFSSAREKELEENPKSNLYIIKHRLQYLVQNGAEPAFFTRDEILDDNFLYSMDKTQEDKIMREYYLQMVSSRKLIPDSKAVDAFENYREELSRSFAHNTIINHHMQRIGLTIGKNVHEFFASNRYSKGEEKNQMVAVGVNFDPVYDDESFLDIIIHELDHAISFFNHKNIGKDDVIKTRGIAVSKLKVVDGHVLEETFDDDLDNLEEFCNQKQTEDLAKLYKSMFGVPKIPQSDTKYRKATTKFTSLYDSFEFLAREFYDMFAPELKMAKVDNIQLFHSYDEIEGKKGKFGNIISFVKDRVGRLISPKTAKSGCMEYSDVLDLAKVITEFRTFSSDHSVRLGNTRNFDMSRLDDMPKFQRNKIREYIDRKNKIIKRMQSNYKGVNNTQPPSTFVADNSFDRENK